MKQDYRLTRGAGICIVITILVLLLSACKSASAVVYAPPYEGTVLQGPAADFSLVDQAGTEISLSKFSGQVILLTFLDSECDDVCPLTAVHLRDAYQALGKDAASVVFLGVNVNEKASSISDVLAATKKWKLDEVGNWHFLTGNSEELEPVWKAYDIAVVAEEQEEIIHSPGVFVIDQKGHKRWYVSTPFDEEGNAQGTADLSDLLIKRARELLRED